MLLKLNQTYIKKTHVLSKVYKANVLPFTKKIECFKKKNYLRKNNAILVANSKCTFVTNCQYICSGIYLITCVMSPIILI